MAVLSPHQIGAIAARTRARLAAQRRTREDRIIDRLLTARRFHPRAFRALATRQRFASVAERLESEIGIADLVSVLWEQTPQPARIRRLARRIGAEIKTDGLAAITLGDLRAVATLNGRIILAALGELSNWESASRRERSARCLNALVAARRAS